MSRKSMVSVVVFLVIFIPSNDTFTLSSVRKVHATPHDYKKVLLELIETFRREMAHGFPQQQIPALDPFAWKRFHVGMSNDNTIKFNAVLMDGTTRGLSLFKIHDLDVQIQKQLVNFHVVFPSVKTDGRYAAKGELAGFVPFDRAGKYSLQLSALALQGSIRYGQWKNRFYIRNITAIPFVKSALVNLDKSSPWKAYLLNRIVSKQIPAYLRNNRHSIAKQIESTVKPKLNEILFNYGINNILQT
uniref:Uncharacterized protein n=1 Tax=Anopheles dirus TaxID=7168 RepID=A0A1Y9H2A5_9DIPT